MNVRFQLLVLEGAKTKEIRKETRTQSLKENSFFCITGVNPFSLTYLSFDAPHIKSVYLNVAIVRAICMCKVRLQEIHSWDSYLKPTCKVAEAEVGMMFSCVTIGRLVYIWWFTYNDPWTFHCSVLEWEVTTKPLVSNHVWVKCHRNTSRWRKDHSHKTSINIQIQGVWFWWSLTYSQHFKLKKASWMNAPWSHTRLIERKRSLWKNCSHPSATILL